MRDSLQTKRFNQLREYIYNEDLSFNVEEVFRGNEIDKLIVTSPYYYGKQHIEWTSSNRFLLYIEDYRYNRRAYHLAKTPKGVLGRLNYIIDIKFCSKTIDENETV